MAEINAGANDFGLMVLVSLMVPRLMFEGIRSIVVIVDDGIRWCTYNHIPLFHDRLKPLNPKTPKP